MSAAPEQRNVVCARHGLGYDAAKDLGCVRCRREHAEASAPRRTFPRIALFAVGGLFLAIFVVALVVAIAGRPDTARSAASSASVPTEGPVETQLEAYLRATWSRESQLPISEARHAFAGMPDEVRQQRLDTDDRRQRIKSYSEKLAAQKAAFESVPAPEPASHHRMLFRNWYAVMGTFVDVANDQLHLYEEVVRINEKRRSLTSRDEQRALNDEIRSTQGRIDHTIERARALQHEAHDLSMQKRAEEERLIRDYKLGIAREKAAPREDDDSF